MFFLKIIESFERYNVNYAVSGAYAAALHGYVQNIAEVEFVVDNSREGLLLVDEALMGCGLQFVEKKSVNLYYSGSSGGGGAIDGNRNVMAAPERVVIYAGFSADDCKSVIKPVLSYKIPVMTLHELQKKLEFQIQNRQLLSEKVFLLKPLEILQILEDYRNLAAIGTGSNALGNWGPRATKDKSILISLKVPESLLEEFREECELQDVRYQTQIKKLMKDWLI
jgi:hypothetical protein